jgi:hypothetical protein
MAVRSHVLHFATTVSCHKVTVDVHNRSTQKLKYSHTKFETTHFSLVHEGSMFLQNVGICLPKTEYEKLSLEICFLLTTTVQILCVCVWGGGGGSGKYTPY